MSMCEISNFPKSWTFELQTLKHTVCPQNNINFKLKWSIVSIHTDITQRSYMYYRLQNSAFWGWLSMESLSQNPEFRNNPENSHPWIHHEDEKCGSWSAGDEASWSGCRQFWKKTMHTVDFLDCHECSKLTIHKKYHAIIVMCEKKSNQTKWNLQKLNTVEKIII